jgi:hypothetical protein
VVAPPEDKEEEVPLHIEVGLATGDKTGLVFTVTVTVAAAEQVVAVTVPITVYTVVEAGVTETGLPDDAPGFQINVVPVILLLALNEEDEPLQIEVGFEAGVMVGRGFTTTMLVPAWLVQPLAVAVTE